MRATIFKFLPFAFLLAAAIAPLHAAAAADQPDLIFKKSTVFKWLSPNDKLATYGLDDPEVEGVACHFTVPEKGGFKGWIGVASGLPLQLESQGRFMGVKSTTRLRYYDYDDAAIKVSAPP